MRFWDEDKKLLLLTPEEYSTVSVGTPIGCIDGSEYVKGKDDDKWFDDDTRFGHLAFGVIGDHPLRLAELGKK